MRRWSNQEIQHYLGNTHGCFLTHSTDERTRKGAASGGTTSQLAINMLEGGYVDGILLWEMSYGGESPSVVPRIARTREEILAGRTSKYSAVNWPRDGIPVVEAFEGTLAVVTLPCDASYLRRKLQAKPELAAKIKCILTLFCGHNSEPELTELVVEKSGVKWRDVTSFSYRTGSWRGRLAFETKDGRRVERPTSHFTNYQNLHFFSERKCLACVDHFGFHSDVSLGDVWSQNHRSREIKPTVAVAKTGLGREVLERFDHDIHKEAITPADVVSGNSRGATFHYNLTARSRVSGVLGLRIPDRLRLSTTLLDRLVALIALFNFWLTHKSRLKRIVHRLPIAVVRSYLIAFKGFQQAGLFFHRPFPDRTSFSIIGGTLSGNRGAEAMVTTSIGKLRERFPEARFVIHSYFPDADRKLCRDLDVEIVSAKPIALVTIHLPFALVDRALRFIGLGVPRRWMPRPIRELAQSRVLLDVSGVSFSDGREKFLPFNVLCNWPALLLGVAVVKLAQALGPFEGRLNRCLAQWTLNRCERVFARGDESKTLCEGLVREDRLDCATDIAFLFDGEYQLTDENRDFEVEACRRIDQMRSEDRRIVTLAVSSVVSGKCRKREINYEGVLARVATEYLGRGLGVVLLPNATREGTSSTRNNDIPIIQGVARRMDSGATVGRLVCIDRGLNTAALRNIIERSDGMLASRFHAMIAGLALGVPTLVLGWGHKYREILSLYGCGEFALDYSAIAFEQLVERIDDLLERQDEIQDRLRKGQDEILRSAGRQFAWLQDFADPEVSLCTGE